jgi:hypothetical protein
MRVTFVPQPDSDKIVVIAKMAALLDMLVFSFFCAQFIESFFGIRFNVIANFAIEFFGVI